jgi:PIN domain nuclease of toxin-antitoxin system
MSGFLLDTNVLIALVNQTHDRLPGPIRDLLADVGVRFTVSVVSPWEISIKSALGKLRLEREVRELSTLIAAFGCTVLPMTMDHAIEVARPEPLTKDPFDRLLLAVCACEGFKLVTTDERISGHRLVY